MIVKGGMGMVPKIFAKKAIEEGARIECSSGVRELIVEKGKVKGAITHTGRVILAKAVVVNADPFRMRDMIGRDKLPLYYNRQLDNWKRDGTTLKINLCLKALPTFTCLPQQIGQHNTTVHIIPEKDIIKSFVSEYEKVKLGVLPEFPTIEM